MSLHIAKDFDNSKDPSLMLEMVKQSGWVNGRGVFKHPEGSVGVKTVVKLSGHYLLPGKKQVFLRLSQVWRLFKAD